MLVLYYVALYKIVVNIFCCEKMLFRKEFWCLSFEDHRTYGLDIPKRLHMKGNMKRQKFIIVQEMEIYEIAWYKIIVLPKSTYMLYKVDCEQGCKFLPHGNKGLHKL